MSIWKVNENELLALGGVAVDAHYLIKELQEKVTELQEAISSKKPVCPYCHKEMEEILFTHYYNSDGYACWECSCDKLPNSRKIYEGY